MKTLPKTLMLLALVCFVANFSFAQQAYLVHQDNVKPSKIGDYEKIAKEFTEICVKHNPKTSWITTATSDFKFLYVTPIENMADLDKRPMAAMAEAMGDEFGAMFKRFDECYDSHGSYVIYSDEELSYMPDGFSQTQEGTDYRDFFWIYYSPKNGDNIREGMKAVKEMFASKESKNYYRIYQSAFGTMDSYYLVAMSSKSKIDSAQKEAANDELLGPERFETFSKVMKYADRMEEAIGFIRRDLGYKYKE